MAKKFGMWALIAFFTAIVLYCISAGLKLFGPVCALLIGVSAIASLAISAACYSFDHIHDEVKHVYVCEKCGNKLISYGFNTVATCTKCGLEMHEVKGDGNNDE